MYEHDEVSVALQAKTSAGSALGLLFARQTGTETRDKLAEPRTKLGEFIKDTTAKQIDELPSLFKQE